MSTFICIGNARRPFSRLLLAVAANLGRLPQPVVVQHGHTPCHLKDCVTIAFLEMQEYVRRVTEAELLIMHAGAGSVIHAIQAGKVPVIMPRCVHYGEHVNDHQVEFAEALAATGKVVVANGKDDLWSMSLEALARQKDAQEAGGNQGMSLLISRIDRTLREYAGQKPT